MAKPDSFERKSPGGIHTDLTVEEEIHVPAERGKRDKQTTEEDQSRSSPAGPRVAVRKRRVAQEWS